MSDQPHSADTRPTKSGCAQTPWIISLALLGFVGVLMLAKSTKQGPLAQMKLADGRILKVEEVTYGTTHRIGHRSFIYDHFAPWMPQKMRDWFAPKSPENTINLERPGLVVWVNAIDPATGTNVDCQEIRTEFVDRHGDLFGQDTSSWFGGQKFFRVGHVFYCYPRDETQLILRVTTWKASKTTSANILNPHIVKPANWSASSLPQSRTVGEIEIVLEG